MTKLLVNGEQTIDAVFTIRSFILLLLNILLVNLLLCARAHARTATCTASEAMRCSWEFYLVCVMRSALVVGTRLHLNCKRFHWYLFRYFRLLFVCNAASFCAASLQHCRKLDVLVPNEWLNSSSNWFVQHSFNYFAIESIIFNAAHEAHYSIECKFRNADRRCDNERSYLGIVSVHIHRFFGNANRQWVQRKIATVLHTHWLFNEMQIGKWKC